MSDHTVHLQMTGIRIAGLLSMLIGIAIPTVCLADNGYCGVVETTSLTGVERGALRRGDQIAVKRYRNHNLAELKLVNRDVRVAP